MKKEEIFEKVWLAVIAGGNGTRLFLFSNENCPKQFCAIDDENTFIQATIERFLKLGINPKHVFIIVTNDAQYELATEQTAERFGVLTANIQKIDPCHGYAGAMIVATNAIYNIDPNAIVVQTPADQFVDANESFILSMNEAITAANDGTPVIIGKDITDANVAKELGNIIYTKTSGNIFEIEDFIEKPEVKTITEIMRRKNSACNTGINIWKADVFDENTPNIEVKTDSLMKEILQNPKLIVGKFQWGDLGNFEALYRLNSQKTGISVIQLGAKDNIRHTDCEEALLITDPSIEINVYGVNDVAIIAREIDGHYYLEISKFGANKEVALASKIYKECPMAFKNGITIGGNNNEFTDPDKKHYHACFIGVSGFKVWTYKRNSGKKGFQISYGI